MIFRLCRFVGGHSLTSLSGLDGLEPCRLDDRVPAGGEPIARSRRLEGIVIAGLINA